MRKLISALLGLGALATVNADPITVFTDIVDPTPDVKLCSGCSQGVKDYTFQHDINDNGFHPRGYKVLAADLNLTLVDDNDPAAENVRIKLDNVLVSQSYQVTAGNGVFEVSPVLLQSDGLLSVNLKVITGDFTFNQSVLNVTAEAVPEPGTMALMGLGILGLGLATRRRIKA